MHYESKIIQFNQNNKHYNFFSKRNIKNKITRNIAKTDMWLSIPSTVFVFPLIYFQISRVQTQIYFPFGVTRYLAGIS